MSCGEFPETRADWRAVKQQFRRKRQPASGLAMLRFPRIQNRYLRVDKVSDIARDDGQVAVKRGCRKQAVNHWQSYSLSLCLGSDQTPAIGNRRINRHYSSGETGLQIDLKPRFQLCPPLVLEKARRPFPNLAQSQNAKME